VCVSKHLAAVLPSVLGVCCFAKANFMPTAGPACVVSLALNTCWKRLVSRWDCYPILQTSRLCQSGMLSTAVYKEQSKFPTRALQHTNTQLSALYRQCSGHSCKLQTV
jgi:hypothetical protein